MKAGDQALNYRGDAESVYDAAMERGPQSWTQIAQMSLLFVVILGGGALIFDRRVRNDARDRTRDLLPLVASLTMEQVDDLVERARGEVEHVAGLLGRVLDLEGKPEAVHAALKGFYSQSVALDMVAIINSEGQLLELASPADENEGGQHETLPGHDLLGKHIDSWPMTASLCSNLGAEGIEKTRVHWGLSALRSMAMDGKLPAVRTGDEPKISRDYDLRIAARIGSSGNDAQGTVVGFMNWNRVQRIINQINNRIRITQKINSGYLFLLQSVDDDYQIIGHKLTRIYGTRLLADHSLTTYATALRNRESISDYEFPAGTEKTSAMAYSRQADLSWVLGAGINFDDIYATSNELRRWTVSFVALVVGVALLASFLFLRSRRIFKVSVEQIIQSAEDMASGAFTQQVQVQEKKDLGRIADAFGRMASSLGQRHELAQAKERPFREIRPNPYIVGNPIRDPKMFFGRQRALSYARERLEAPGVGLALVFCGDRRSGKTSILCQLQGGVLGDEFRPVMVDLQALAAVSSEADFYEGLWFEIAEGVKEAEGIEMVSGENPARAFQQALNGILDRLGDRRLVLLMDEYETLDELILSSKVPGSAVTILASLLEATPPVSLVLTGSRPLREREGDVWTALINRAIYRKVGFLHREEAEALITRPLDGLVQFDFGVVDRILALTAGHPYYTQIVCQTLVDHLNRARRNVADLHDLASVIEEVLADPPPQMTYFWKRGLELRERCFLSLLAEEIKEEAVHVSPERILERGKEAQLPTTLDSGLLDQMIRHHESTGFLSMESQKVGFRMDLFRLHIREAHPLYQVTREETDQS